MNQLQRAFYLLTTRKLANFDFASHYILQYQRVIHDLRHRYGFNVIMERTGCYYRDGRSFYYRCCRIFRYFLNNICIKKEI